MKEKKIVCAEACKVANKKYGLSNAQALGIADIFQD